MIKNKDAEKYIAQRKRKAQFWQVKTFLNSLRLKYRENNVGKDNYSISAPLFGLRFRFNGVEEPEDRGWGVFLLSKSKLEKDPHYFREDVLWFLVARGYMGYIRESEMGGNERVFRAFIIDAGWGLRIMEKRLELYGNSAEYNYLRLKTEEFMKMPLPKVISHYPDFFDYLL